MAGHSCWRMFLILFTALVFLATLVINAFSTEFIKELYDPGLFLSDTGNISDEYTTEITPADFVFAIWGAIYIYQLIFIIYCLTTLCQKTNDSYLYIKPALICPSAYIFYILNLGTNIAWLFTFDREWMIESLGVLAGCVFTLYCTIGIIMHGISSNMAELIRQDKRGQIVACIAIALNGLAMYATWVSIACLINVNIVLHYDFDVDLHIASSIALSALALDILVYALIDLVLFERHFRYVYTPYLVLALALVGSIWANWDVTNSNSVFTVAIAAMSAILFMVKFIMSIIRSRTDPIFTEDSGVKGMSMAIA